MALALNNLKRVDIPLNKRIQSFFFYIFFLHSVMYQPFQWDTMTVSPEDKKYPCLKKKKQYLGYDTKLQLIVRIQFWRSGKCGILLHDHYSLLTTHLTAFLFTILSSEQVSFFLLFSKRFSAYWIILIAKLRELRFYQHLEFIIIYLIINSFWPVNILTAYCHYL